MVRSSIAEEIEHLERIAFSLGHLRNASLSLPLTVNDISSWIQKLETLVLNTDQLDLQAIFLANKDKLGTLTEDNCKEQLECYTGLINQMRSRLYELKAINRSAQSGQREAAAGSYRLLPGGRILFRDNEIAFGGKLKAILVAFLANNTEHTLTAAEIADIWGDGNVAAVPRHRSRLEEKLAPYYGDRHKHVNRVQTSPLTYKLDIE